jgi:hypothetical protein
MGYTIFPYKMGDTQYILTISCGGRRFRYDLNPDMLRVQIMLGPLDFAQMAGEVPTDAIAMGPLVLSNSQPTLDAPLWNVPPSSVIPPFEKERPVSLSPVYFLDSMSLDFVQAAMPDVGEVYFCTFGYSTLFQ